MERYPPPARTARVKCITCNAPTTLTVDGNHVCVACGRTIVGRRRPADGVSGDRGGD